MDQSISLKAQLKVDQLCDEFELQWKSTVPSFQQFVQKCRQAVPVGFQATAIAQLCKIDLEYRWTSALCKATVAKDSLGTCPCIGDYLNAFPGSFCIESVPADLVALEYRLKKMAGAEPKHQEFLDKYAIDGLKQVLQRVDREVLVEQEAEFDRAEAGIRIQCPHCRHEFASDIQQATTDLACTACRQTFSITSSELDTKSAQPLRKIGPFQLMHQLGIGSFGSVWKARDTLLDRTVAIKIPRRGKLTEREEAQFFREAKVAAQLVHPNIVAVHDINRDGDTVYIVSDFIRGVTLSDWLTGKRPTFRTAAKICEQIAQALHHAHEKGVIHRDLKPSNIIMDAQGTPFLTDFGLAKQDSTDVTVTLDGQILGTPAYMSPEQARGDGHAADRRTDIYSLGVILFQLLTGEIPFRGNARMTMHQVLHDEPVQPRKLDSNIPKDLETLCLRCLQKSAKRRFANAGVLAEELDRFIQGQPVVSRSIGRLERMLRWTHRNPFQAAFALLLFAVAIASPLIAWRQGALRNEAEIAKQDAERLAENNQVLAKQAARRGNQAEQALKDAQLVSDYLVSVFGSPMPHRDGRKITVAETLNAAVQKLRIDRGMSPSRKAKLFETLALTQMGLGLFRDATVSFQSAQQIHELARGASDREALRLRIELARAYELVTDLVNAKRHGLIAYNNSLQAHGADDPITVDARSVLQLVEFRVGNFSFDRRRILQAAFDLHRRTTEMTKENGIEDVSVLKHLADASIWFAETGNPDAAIEWLQRAIPTMERKLGNELEHASTLKAKITLEVAKSKVSPVELSISSFEKLYDAAQGNVGAGHRPIVFAGRELAKAYERMQKWDDAKRIYQQILHREQQLQANEPNESMRNIRDRFLPYYHAKINYCGLTSKLKLSKPLCGGHNPVWLNSNEVAFVSSDRTKIQKVDISNGSETALADGDASQMSVCPKRNLLIVVRGENAESDTIWALDLDAGELQPWRKGGSISWSDDGESLFFHNRATQRLQYVKWSDRAISASDFNDRRLESMSALVSPNGKMVIHGKGYYINVSDFREKRVVLMMPWIGSSFPIARMAWTSDSRFAAIGHALPGTHEGLFILDVLQNRFFQIGSGNLTAVSFSPDGKQLAVENRSLEGSTIHLCDLPDLDGLSETIGVELQYRTGGD